MIKDIVKYPTPPSTEYSTDVRKFNDELFSILDNLKDTISANNLDGLACFQIGSFYNIVVVKDKNGDFLELINPRIIKTKGKQTTLEKTAYFGDLEAEVIRYDEISLVYQDRDAKDKSLQADGEFSILLQRKIDYTFGSSFINKLTADEREKFEMKLEHGGDMAIAQSCPTVFKRDYFKKGVNLLSILMVVIFVISLFVDEQMQQQMWTTQINIFLTALGVNIGYFFYGYYEGKKFSSCTSCQIGNIIGTFSIALFRLLAILGLSYIFIA